MYRHTKIENMFNETRNQNIKNVSAWIHRCTHGKITSTTESHMPRYRPVQEKKINIFKQNLEY